jgi:hypothetical protein
MPTKPKNRADLEALLNAKAWKDPKFKKKLLSDPNAVLKEMGVDLKNLKVRIVEDDANTVTFVLHPAPQNAASMNEEELRKVAGGCTRYSGCQESYCPLGTHQQERSN